VSITATLRPGTVGPCPVRPGGDDDERHPGIEPAPRDLALVGPRPEGRAQVLVGELDDVGARREFAEPGVPAVQVRDQAEAQVGIEADQPPPRLAPG
jgi:hypothetical protein